MTSKMTLKMLKFKGSVENDSLSVMHMRMTKMIGKHIKERCRLRISIFVSSYFDFVESHESLSFRGTK